MSEPCTDPFSQSFFTLFQLSESFDLESDILTQRYQKLQAMLHPDRFARATDQEKRLSVQYSALINQAYQTLKSPVLRALYLLEQRGVVLNQHGTESVGSDFLGEQMHWHEALAEVMHSEQPQQALYGLQKTLTQKIGDTERAFSQCWQEQTTDTDLSQARQLVMQMQFLDKIAIKAKQLGNTAL